MLRCSLLLKKFVGEPSTLASPLSCDLIDDVFGMDEKTLEILKTLTPYLTCHNSNVSCIHNNSVIVIYI